MADEAVGGAAEGPKVENNTVTWVFPVEGEMARAWRWITGDPWRLAAMAMGAMLLIAVAHTYLVTLGKKETGERVRCFKCLTQTNNMVMGKLVGMSAITSNEINPATGQSASRVRTYLVYVCKAGHIQMVERDATVVDTAAVGK